MRRRRRSRSYRCRPGDAESDPAAMIAEDGQYMLAEDGAQMIVE